MITQSLKAQLLCGFSRGGGRRGFDLYYILNLTKPPIPNKKETYPFHAGEYLLNELIPLSIHVRGPKDGGVRKLISEEKKEY
jgi:hypothetical protein